jgi:hypothetical protein
MSQRIVRIFVPPRSAMQSGKAKTQHWAVEYLPAEAKQLEPLMGWSGSGDTERQLRLTFPTKEAAIAWAAAKGLAYELEEPAPKPPIKPKVYADNFKYGRTVNWTH